MEHIEQGDCAQNSCCDDFDNVDFCDMYYSVSRNSSVDVAIFSMTIHTFLNDVLR